MSLMGNDPLGERTAGNTTENAHIPRHVAIIMDGNGRWAEMRGWTRTMGHAQGASRVKEIIREADRLRIKVLTLYCFSTENWQRPPAEVSTLMKLLKEYLLKERQELFDNNIRLQALGQVERIPEETREIVLRTVEETKNNTGLVLNFCISYGARAELVRAMQTLAKLAQENVLRPEDIGEELISNSLYTNGLPDPDLIIRTSGEFRISNFLLWQAAYSEFYVTDTLWPDFDKSDLQKAVEAFGMRKRRFGRSDETEISVHT